MNHFLQDSIVSQRRKSRERWSPEFHPKGVLDKQGAQIFFCQNEIKKLFCIGYQRWKILTEEVKLPMLRKHKNVGNTFVYFDYKNEVLEYLSEVGHSSEESQVMQFVRELTGIGVSDEECNGVTIPAFYLKQKMHNISVRIQEYI